MSEALQRRFVMLMCLKCSGDLEKLDDDELAVALRLSPDDLAETKAIFLRKGFIDDQWTLRNWDRRQYLSDNSTGRVREHRERQKHSSVTERVEKRPRNVSETFQKRRSNGHVTPPETEADTETDTETELHKNSAKSRPQFCGSRANGAQPPQNDQPHHGADPPQHDTEPQQQSPPPPQPPQGTDRTYRSKRGKQLSGQSLVWFEEFWQAFDLKRGKAEAADAWLALGPISAVLAADIIAGARREAAARPALIASGASPKWPQGWLSGRRWEDDPRPMSRRQALEAANSNVAHQWAKGGEHDP